MFNQNHLLKHKKYMDAALKLARTAFHEDEVPVGAVVVHKNHIVGRGYNQVELLGDPTAHAEMLALSAACDTLKQKYLHNCSLYVTLEPCAMCSGAIVWAKIDRVVFGAMDERAGGCGSVFNIAENKQLNHQAEIIQGIMEEESKELLRTFFEKRRR